MASSKEELVLTVRIGRSRKEETRVVVSCEMNGCVVYREKESKKIYWGLTDYARSKKLHIIKVDSLNKVL